MGRIGYIDEVPLTLDIPANKNVKIFICIPANENEGCYCSNYQNFKP